MDKIHAKKAFSLNQILSWVSFASCERKPKLVVLFICNISSKCELSELMKYKSPNRIEVDLDSHQVRVWNMEYRPKKPDVIISGAHHGRQVRSRSHLVES